MTLLVIAYTPLLYCLIVDRFINGTLAYYSVYLFNLGYLLDYFLEFYILLLIERLLSSIKPIIGKCFNCILITLVSLMSVLNIGCLFSLGSTFSKNHVFLIKATNDAEAKGFFSHYFSATIWTEISIGILIIVILLFLINKRNGIASLLAKWQYTPISGFICVVISTVVLLYLLINPINPFFVSYQNPFKQYNQWDMVLTELFAKVKPLKNPVPSLNPKDAKLPRNIIFAIGESADRDNMSLYGYPINNTPSLLRLSNDSTIVNFTQAFSPACLTTRTFYHILTTDDGTEKRKSSVPYTDCETLPTIMKSLGYKTFFLSSQFPAQITQDVIPQFAELCDSVRYLTLEGSQFDGDITAPLKNLLTSDEIPKFIMINVKGSHEDFNDRYPQAYARFKEEDYPADLPIRKRQILAAYDNSIAYTDDVISQWIEAAAASGPSLLIYFSDHGLDLYESNEIRCGHGDPDNQASYEASIKVPLLFYFSDEYKATNPEAWEKLIENRNKPVNTTDLIATLMDILNVDFTDKPGFIERNSMLSDKYVTK